MNILLVSSTASNSLVNIMERMDKSLDDNFYFALYSPLKKINFFDIVRILRRNRMSLIFKKIIKLAGFGKSCPDNLRFAKNKNLDVYIFDDINSPEFQVYIRQKKIDLLVTFDCEKILRIAIIKAPRILSINVHNSLLPRYRGTDPVYWMLVNKEKQAGVTIHVISEKIDEGDILLQRPAQISEAETYDSLCGKLFRIGTDMFFDLIEDIKQNQILMSKQDEYCATYYNNKRMIYGNLNQ